MNELSRFLPPSPPRTKSYYLNQEAASGNPQFYECGICSAMHAASWDGDCREDAARLDIEDIDARFGAFGGWEEIDMPGACEDEDSK